MLVPPMPASARSADIIDYINPGDCLVVNNTRVVCARFFAARLTGAKIEGLYLQQSENGWVVMLKNSRKIKPGEELTLFDRNKKPHSKATAIEKLDNGQWILNVDTDLSPEEFLSNIGYAPLPPYIKRPDGGEDCQTDIQRYQTVYADQSGAVAAPTAGPWHKQQRLC